MINQGAGSKTAKDHKYYFLLLVALFSVFAYFHIFAKELVFSSFADFGNYWLNASLTRKGYNIWAQDKQCEAERERLAKENDFVITPPSTNSLFFLALVQFFAGYDYRQAVVLWNITGLAALLCSVWIILRTLKIRRLSSEMFMALFLVFSFWPVREALHDGQVCFITLFFMAASVYLMKEEKWFWAGILLSLAIQTKEYLAVSLVAFLLKRNWRVLFGVAVGILLAKLLEIRIFGWAMELSYWQFIFNFGRNITYSVNNHVFFSAIGRVGEGMIGAGACNSLSLLLIAAITLLTASWTRKTQDMLLVFFPFLILSFLITPWIHESHFIILYPAIIILWFFIAKTQNLNYYIFFILAYLLLGLGYSLNSFPVFHHGILAVFTTGKIIGMTILLALSAQIAYDAGAGKLIIHDRQNEEAR